jgi:Domain of unknown function (DUF4062)
LLRSVFEDVANHADHYFPEQEKSSRATEVIAAATAQRREANTMSQMRRRYGVFISSTYIDLRDEREALMRVILEGNCFPLGMELFGADAQEPWAVIEKKIAECDYYMLIVALRYGSLFKHEQISYTEKEYDYATSIGKPVVAFVLDREAESTWKPGFIDAGVPRAELDRFKQKIFEQKTVSTWKNCDQLAKNAVVALHRLIEDYPMPGWVRGDETSSMTAGTVLSTAEVPTDPVSNHLEAQATQTAQQPNIDQYYNRGERAILGLFAERGKRHLVFRSAVMQTVPTFARLIERGVLKKETRSDGSVLSISDDAWGLSRSAAFTALLRNDQEDSDKSFVQRLQQALVG